MVDLFGHDGRHASKPARTVVVLGLGRFGSALSQELARSRVEVLGIDNSQEVVEAHADILTHVARADVTKPEALRQLGVSEFDRAFVAIAALETSILAASWCIRFGIPTVWAKATSEVHGQILTQIGVHKVVYPEADMGKRVAHLVRDNMLEFLPIGGGFVMFTALTPKVLVNKPIESVGFRSKYGLNVVAVKGADGKWRHAEGATVLEADDIIMVTGPAEAADNFNQLR